MGGMRGVHRLMAATLVLALAAGLAGCQTMGSTATDTVREHPGTVIGAGTGAVGGAVVGGLVGGTRGAVVGGLLGGLAGGVIGNYVERRDDPPAAAPVGAPLRTEEDAGVHLERVQASPVIVPAGGTVDLGATYTVLGVKDQSLTVSETREIRHEGQLVANATTNVARTNGTYTTSLPITLPPTASSGRYDVTTTVALADRRVSQTSTFQVQ
jgi:hypothetical protein